MSPKTTSDVMRRDAIFSFIIVYNDVSRRSHQPQMTAFGDVIADNNETQYRITPHDVGFEKMLLHESFRRCYCRVTVDKSCWQGRVDKLPSAKGVQFLEPRHVNNSLAIVGYMQYLY
jgi:hypothetical protein